VVAIRYTVAPTADDDTEAPAFGMFIDDTFDSLRFMNLTLSGVVNVGDHNPYDLIGNAISRENTPMFHYNGSLTVPSCDSITSWYIVQQTVMLSQAQMHQLRFFTHVNKTAYENQSLGFSIDANIRPVAPLNGRDIVAWPEVLPPNMSSDSAPDSGEPSSSQPPFALSTGAIIGICVAGVVIIVTITVLITSLICKGVIKKEYESINNSA